MTTLAFLRKVLRLARPFWLRLSVGVLCGFLAGLTNPLLIGSIKLAVDTTFPDQGGAPALAGQVQKLPGIGRQVARWFEQWTTTEGHTTRTWMLIAILTVPLAMFLRGLFTYLNVYLMNWVAIRVVTNLRTRLFEHLLSLSASFHNRNSTGELMYRFHDVAALQAPVSNALVVIIKEPITVISLATYLLMRQPWLTVGALVVFALTVLPFMFFVRKVRKSSAAIHERNAALGKLTHEALTGYRIVKAYNLEPRLVDDFKRASRAAISHFMRILRSAELPGPLMEFLGAIGVALFFIYAAFFAPVPMKVSDLMGFIAAIFLMYQPIKSIIRLHTQLQQADAATTPIFEILATQPAVAEPAHPVPLRAAGQGITFENVSFRYEGVENTILRNIDLIIPAGRMVALVGQSGGGKTTLTNLLLRFYDPEAGVIRIGDTDIRQVLTRDLRAQIAVVTQETVIFDDTIKNNIALGRPDATDAEIVQAAKHALAHDFILEKAQGYDTVIGERGVLLSGGQRQRIAIARAILKNAPILILDEATNSLDAESERAVQAALNQLMNGRTTICIAHRLSTIQRADLIVVMKNGQIVEKDSHEDLLKQRGHYQRLYELSMS